MSSTTRSITQFGITWTFDRDYQYGTFANGDHWVVGPVKIVDINPSTVRTPGAHGSMLDPVIGDTHGYGTLSPGGLFGDVYDPALNVALQLPNLNIGAGHSLVSAISKVSTNDSRPHVSTAAVLTVLASVPPANSFRPAFAGGAPKVPQWTAANLDYSKLARVPMVGTPFGTYHTPANLAAVVRYFERPWLDQAGSGWMAQYFNPSLNMESYGREVSGQTQRAALLLQTDLSNAEKAPLLIRMVQTGIDLYGLSRTPLGSHRWDSADGHNGGRKVPIVIAGMVLNDAGMKTPSAVFAEDDQTYYGQGWFGTSGSNYSTALWRGVTGREYEHKHPRYWTVDGRGRAGDPGAGSASDYRSEEYRHCCTAITWPGTALAIRLMGPAALAAWNHPAFFDYMDRWMTQTWDPFASIVLTETGAGAPNNQGGGDDWAREMWNTYR